MAQMLPYVRSNPALAGLDWSQRRAGNDLVNEERSMRLAHTQQDRDRSLKLDEALRQAFGPQAGAGGPSMDPLMSALADVPGGGALMLERDTAQTDRRDSFLDSALDLTIKGNFKEADAIMSHAGFLDEAGQPRGPYAMFRHNPNKGTGIKYAKDMGYSGQQMSAFMPAWLKTGDLSQAMMAVGAPPSGTDLTISQQSKNAKIDSDRARIRQWVAQHGRAAVLARTTTRGINPETGWPMLDQTYNSGEAAIMRSALGRKTGDDPEYDAFVTEIFGGQVPTVDAGDIVTLPGETAGVPEGAETPPQSTSAPVATAAPEPGATPEAAPVDISDRSLASRAATHILEPSRPLVPGDEWSNLDPTSWFGGDDEPPAPTAGPVPGAQGVPESTAAPGPAPIAQMTVEDLQALDRMAPEELAQRYSVEELQLAAQRLAELSGQGGAVAPAATAAPTSAPAPTPAPTEAPAAPMSWEGLRENRRQNPNPLTGGAAALIDSLFGGDSPPAPESAMPAPPANPNAQLMQILQGLQGQRHPLEPALDAMSAPTPSQMPPDLLPQGVTALTQPAEAGGTSFMDAMGGRAFNPLSEALRADLPGAMEGFPGESIDPRTYPGGGGQLDNMSLDQILSTVLNPGAGAAAAQKPIEQMSAEELVQMLERPETTTEQTMMILQRLRGMPIQ